MKKIKIAGLTTILLVILSVFKLYSQNGDSQHLLLKNKSGRWSVTMTMKTMSYLKPTTINGLIADRKLVGDYCMHEQMSTVPGSKIPVFTRLSDLAFNKNELRWDYISIDTRVTAGIMFFIYRGVTKNTINSFITSFPHPGFGPQLTGGGQAVYLRNEVITIDNNHDLVRQYWRFIDKPEWLAVEYKYTRVK